MSDQYVQWIRACDAAVPGPSDILGLSAAWPPLERSHEFKRLTETATASWAAGQLHTCPSFNAA